MLATHVAGDAMMMQPGAVDAAPQFLRPMLLGMLMMQSALHMKCARLASK